MTSFHTMFTLSVFIRKCSQFYSTLQKYGGYQTQECIERVQYIACNGFLDISKTTPNWFWFCLDLPGSVLQIFLMGFKERGGDMSTQEWLRSSQPRSRQDLHLAFKSKLGPELQIINLPFALCRQYSIHAFSRWLWNKDDISV